MASRLFQSAQHLRLARGKRSAKAGVEARSIIGKVKSEILLLKEEIVEGLKTI